MKENQDSHFNQEASTWDTPEKIEHANQYAQAIINILGKKDFARILEVGCGTGLLGSQFWQDDNHYVGLDTSKEMLKILHGKRPHSDLVRSYLLNMDTEEVPEKDFDLMISSMAFHHLKDPKTTVRNLAPHLTSKGAVAIIDLLTEDGSFHSDPKNMGVHHFGFSKEEITEWAEELGAKVMHLDTIRTISKNGKEYPLFLAVFQRG